MHWRVNRGQGQLFDRMNTKRSKCWKFRVVTLYAGSQGCEVCWSDPLYSEKASVSVEVSSPGLKRWINILRWFVEMVEISRGS
jgi:hypothetical protein